MRVPAVFFFFFCRAVVSPGDIFLCLCVSDVAGEEERSTDERGVAPAGNRGSPTKAAAAAVTAATG